MDFFKLIWLATFPGIILFAIIYLQDKYDREPFKLLIKIFLFGMLSTVPTIIAELIGGYLNIFSGIIGLAVETFLVIGLAEEFFKRKVVMKIALNHPAFNERLDGIVYCTIAALGFATLENIFYVFSYYTEQPGIWITRGLLSVPAHMLFGITMGYYLSMAKFCPDEALKKKYLKKSLWIPALLHGLFDFLLMSSNPYLVLLVVPLVIYLWVANMKKLRLYRRDSKFRHDILDE